MRAVKVEPTWCLQWENEILQLGGTVSSLPAGAHGQSCGQVPALGSRASSKAGPHHAPAGKARIRSICRSPAGTGRREPGGSTAPGPHQASSGIYFAPPARSCRLPPARGRAVRIHAEGCVGGRAGEQAGGQQARRPTAAAPFPPLSLLTAPRASSAGNRAALQRPLPAVPRPAAPPALEASEGRWRSRPALRRPLAGAARHNNAPALKPRSARRRRQRRVPPCPALGGSGRGVGRIPAQHRAFGHPFISTVTSATPRPPGRRRDPPAGSWRAAVGALGVPSDPPAPAPSRNVCLQHVFAPRGRVLVQRLHLLFLPLPALLPTVAFEGTGAEQMSGTRRR